MTATLRQIRPTAPRSMPTARGEIEAVKPVIERLKETGWTFGSHTWGHIRLDTKPLQTVTQRHRALGDEVGSLVGPTHDFVYPHGAVPTVTTGTRPA